MPEPVGATDDCDRPSGPVRHVLRSILPVAIGGVVVFVMVSSSSGIVGAWRAMGRMNKEVLIGAVGAEILVYLLLSFHLRLLAGHPTNARRAAPFRIALVVFGLGNVLPAAPAEGLVMAGAALKRRRMDPRRIAVLLGFSQWFSTRAIFAVAAMDALVAVALGDIPHPYRGGVLGGAVVTISLLILSTWLSLRRPVAEWVAGVVLRVRYWRHPPDRAEQRRRGAAWHEVLLHVSGDWRQRSLLMATAGAAWVCDGLCMYLALRAVGSRLGLEQLLIAYTVGVIASNVPLIPAGLGIVETLTPLILLHYGVPWTNAIAAVLTYRLLGTLLPAVAGALAVVGLRLESPVSVEPETAPGPVLPSLNRA